MGRAKSQHYGNKDVTFSSCVISSTQSDHNERSHAKSGLFASVGQVRLSHRLTNYVSMPESGFLIRLPTLIEQEEEEERVLMVKKKKNKRVGFKFSFKLENESLRRLVSGGVAGAVSRCAVAPLETIKTHLMVGNSTQSSAEVFKSIVRSDGWRGLYRGNLVNVIRVAPNKAIELFAYDTVKSYLSSRPGEESGIPIPASFLAGAVAGFSSTLCTYPLELLKTRLTVQRGVYRNSLHALSTILRDEGASELYRGLVPSLIGVIPYAAANYCTYDALRKAHKRVFDEDEIGNLTTLLMGSAAAAISSCATFPLEVARKQMQAGSINGTQYKNMVDALVRIVEREGIRGLYRGIGPSCMKLVPAAGISFMCYEACKRVMIENKQEI